MSQSIMSSKASHTVEEEIKVNPGNKPLGGVEVKVSELKFYEMLGQGAGGCVKKVVHKPTKKFMALKEISFN